MADNKRWFKVWTTLLIDKINEDFTFEEIGMFTLLGCLIAQKGDNGNISVSKKLFKTFFDNEKLPENFCSKFHIKTGSNDNGNISVSIDNWHKYQKDSTGYERLKKWRNKQNETHNDNGDKIRKDKIRKDKIKEDKKRVFIPPTLDEVKAYCLERKNNVNPEKWHNHYQAKNWMIGKNKMVDWKAAVRTWEEVGFTSEQEAGRNHLKADLKQAYSDLKIKEGFLGDMDESDQRRGKYLGEVDRLKKKIEVIERRLQA